MRTPTKSQTTIDPPGRAAGIPAPTWMAWLGGATILALAAAPGDFPYPATLLGPVVYPAMQLLCRDCRFDPSRPISPRNWALFVFSIQLVGLPCLVHFLGPYQGTLPYLPCDFAINLAIVFVNLAYVIFCLGYQWTWARSSRRSAVARPVDRGADPSRSWVVVATYIGLGLMGLFFTFGDLGGLVLYFTRPSEVRALAASTTDTTSAAIGTFLKPFLGFGFVMIWCNRADRWGRTGPGTRGLREALALGLPVLLSYATFNYNRGAFIAPLIALTGVYLSRVRRVSLLGLSGFAASALILVSLLGLYRSGESSLGDLLGHSTSRQGLEQEFDPNGQVQVYGGSPQFFAFLLEESEYGRDLSWGRTLVSSAMSPVPIVGVSFRPTSGTDVFNRMIYGEGGSHDQVVPFGGELFLDFHVAGLLLGFGLLGLLVARLERASVGSTSALDLFVRLYAAYWLCFLIFGGLAVVAQVFIFFFWPIYGLIILRQLVTLIRGISPGLAAFAACREGSLGA